jgi:hypothetical protein
MPAKPWVVLPLVLPVGDKEYRVQPVTYEDGLTLIAVNNSDSETITDKDDDETLFKLVMGDTWAEMLTDRCPYPVMWRAGMASMQYQAALVNGLDSTSAVEIGERVWNSGIDPELMAAMVAAADFSKTSKPSTSTGTASKTPPRASTKATRSRKATPRTATANKPPARRSSGPRSSSSGRS